MAHGKLTTIYVALLHEGTDCWRPVEASLEDDGTFLITGPVPEFEDWEFPSGARVLCERKKFTDGKVGLVAIRQLS